MPPMAPEQDGVAGELQRIEHAFQTQRASLAAGAARFHEWNAAWKTRQDAIDASLMRIRQTLQQHPQRLHAQRLKIVSDGSVTAQVMLQREWAEHEAAARK